MSDDLTLTVGGRIHGGWTSVEVVRSMEALVGTFSLGVTERWPGQPRRREIAPGDACTVAIGGDIVITGWVDDVEPSYSADNHAVSIRGRDATGDLVDCSAVHEPGEWHDRKIEAIAADLCQPFGIEVSTETYTGKAFKDFRIEEGETVYEAIERACRQRGVLAVSDGAGGLVFTRADPDARVPGALKPGKDGNILAASGRYSNRDRHDSYTVKGQSAGGDGFFGKDAAEPAAEAVDLGIERHRPLVVIAEDQGDGDAFADRARWEANVRAGRSRAVTVTVQGWRHAGGDLWRPNTIVTIDDDWLAANGDMIVAAVKFTRSESGSLAELTLAMPSAFKLLPIAQAEEPGGW